MVAEMAALKFKFDGDALPPARSDQAHGFTIGESRLHVFDQVAELFRQHTKQEDDALFVDGFMPQPLERTRVAVDGPVPQSDVPCLASRDCGSGVATRKLPSGPPHRTPRCTLGKQRHHVCPLPLALGKLRKASGTADQPQTVLRACRDCSFPGGGGYAAEGSLGFFAPPRPSLPAAPGSLSSHSACTAGVPQLGSPRSTFGSIATQSTPRFRSVNETPVAMARDRAFWRFSQWNLRFAVCLAWHAPIKNCVSTETAEGRAQISRRSEDPERTAWPSRRIRSTYRDRGGETNTPKNEKAREQSPASKRSFLRGYFTRTG